MLDEKDRHRLQDDGGAEGEGVDTDELQTEISFSGLPVMASQVIPRERVYKENGRLLLERSFVGAFGEQEITIYNVTNVISISAHFGVGSGATGSNCMT